MCRMRPFHFMVTFWGERYRDYFVDLFFPSMLASNNLRLLQAQDEHRFFIATPREDWQAIKELPIMDRPRQHAAHPRSDCFRVGKFVCRTIPRRPACKNLPTRNGREVKDGASAQIVPVNLQQTGLLFDKTVVARIS